MGKGFWLHLDNRLVLFPGLGFGLVHVADNALGLHLVDLVLGPGISLGNGLGGCLFEAIQVRLENERAKDENGEKSNRTKTFRIHTCLSSLVSRNGMENENSQPRQLFHRVFFDDITHF